MTSDIVWGWYPRPPEMVRARLKDNPACYLYECVGTAINPETGERERVWMPDSATAFREDVVDELKEKHGLYVESLSDARAHEEFVEVSYQHTEESDKNYELRKNNDA